MRRPLGFTDRLDQVYAAIPAREAPIRLALQLILDAGLLPKTVLGLRAGDVTISGSGTPIARITFVAGRERRAIVIDDPALVAALARHLQIRCADGGLLFRDPRGADGTPLSYPTLLARWADSCRQANVNAALFHVLVREHATARQQRGLVAENVAAIRAWMACARARRQRQAAHARRGEVAA